MPFSCVFPPPVEEVHEGGVAALSGFGTSSNFGNSGRTITVSNLNDSGPGSFRDAVETQSGQRQVVFNVSGTVPTAAPVVARNAGLTVRGSTAPGDGFRLQATPANNTFVFRTVTTDILVENIGFYHNNDSTGNVDNRDTVNISNGSRRVVMSQCTMMWGADETVSVFHSGGSVGDITLQYCLIAEGLSEVGHSSGEHSKGLLIGNGLRNITVHHNWFTRNARRNFRFDGDLIQAVNNVIISNCDERFRPLTFGRRGRSVQYRYDILHNRVYGTDGPERGALVYPPQVFNAGAPSVHSLGNIHDGSRTSNAQPELAFYGGYGGGQPPNMTLNGSPHVGSSPGLCTHTDVSNDDLRDFLAQCVGAHSWERNPNDQRVMNIQPDSVGCTNRAIQLY